MFRVILSVFCSIRVRGSPILAAVQRQGAPAAQLGSDASQGYQDPDWTVPKHKAPLLQCGTDKTLGRRVRDVNQRLFFLVVLLNPLSLLCSLLSLFLPIQTVDLSSFFFPSLAPFGVSPLFCFFCLFLSLYLFRPCIPLFLLLPNPNPLPHHRCCAFLPAKKGLKPRLREAHSPRKS